MKQKIYIYPLFHCNSFVIIFSTSFLYKLVVERGPLCLRCYSVAAERPGQPPRILTADWRNDYHQPRFSSISAALGGPLPHAARLTLKLHRIQFKPSFSLGSR